MTTSNATVEREYSLEYNYYKKGNWMMDSCEEINIKNWYAEPLEMPVFTKKEIAELIFSKHKLKSNIKNARFTTWTSVYNESIMFDGIHLEPDEYIYQVDRSDSDENYSYSQTGKFSTTVYIKAESSAFAIYEDIVVDWKFHPVSLIWEPVDKYSVGYRVENKGKLNGFYERIMEYGLSSAWNISITNISSDGIITGTENAPLGYENLVRQWQITGLHEAQFIGEEQGVNPNDSRDLIINFNTSETIYHKGTWGYIKK